MLSTLTILSLDQGKIYSPPPDRLDEPATTGQNREPQPAPHRQTTGLGHFLGWLAVPGAIVTAPFRRVREIRREPSWTA